MGSTMAPSIAQTNMAAKFYETRDRALELHGLTENLLYLIYGDGNIPALASSLGAPTNQTNKWGDKLNELLLVIDGCCTRVDLASRVLERQLDGTGLEER